MKKQREKVPFRQAVVFDSLKRCELFAGLPTETVRKVANFSRVKNLKKGEHLFHEGDAAEGFYVVQRGIIQIHRVNMAGKEQLLHTFRERESFAEASLTEEGGYPASAKADGAASVILIPKKEFLAALRRQPELALRLLKVMSRRLRVLVGWVNDLTLKNVETRLADWLSRRCPQPLSGRPVTIRLGMAKRALAAEIGTTSETLSRTLANLRNQRLISVNGREICVLDSVKLTHLAKQS